MVSLKEFIKEPRFIIKWCILLYLIGRLSVDIYIYLFGNFNFNFDFNFVLNQIKDNNIPIFKGVVIVSVLSIITKFIFDRFLSLFRGFLNWTNKIKLPLKVWRKIALNKVKRKKTLNNNLKKHWNNTGKFNLIDGKIVKNEWTESLNRKMFKGNITNTALQGQVFNLIICLLICSAYFNLYVLVASIIFFIGQIFYMIVYERAIVFDAIKFKRELK